MSILVTRSEIPDVLIIDPKVHSDQRGFFLETYHKGKYSSAGLDATFVQDNHSRSRKNTVRGLHYQATHPQGKLVFALTGEVFDVAVDLRSNSPTFGKWMGIHLNAENHRQIYVPPGFAHGFCVLSDVADVAYKCTDIYYPEDDFGIFWNDPEIGIHWPVQDPVLSSKDLALPRLADVPPHRLPR